MEEIQRVNEMSQIIKTIETLYVDIASNAKILTVEQKLKNYNELKSLAITAEKLLEDISNSIKKADFGKVKNKAEYEALLKNIELIENPKINLQEAISMYADIIRISNSITNIKPNITVVNSDVMYEEVIQKDD